MKKKTKKIIAIIMVIVLFACPFRVKAEELEETEETEVIEETESVPVWDEDGEYFDSVADRFIEQYNVAGGMWFESTYDWGTWEDKAQALMEEAQEHFNLFCESYNETVDYYSGMEEYKDSQGKMEREAGECIALLEKSIMYWKHIDPDTVTEIEEVEEYTEEVEQAEQTEAETIVEIMAESEEIISVDEIVVYDTKQREIVANRSIETWCTHGALDEYRCRL